MAGEEHDAPGKTVGVPEPVPVEHRVVHEDAAGPVPEHADVEFETPWRQVTFRLIDCFYDRVEPDDLLSPFFPGGVSAEHREHVTTWWC